MNATAARTPKPDTTETPEAAARRLTETATEGALATVDAGGHPLSTLVIFALDAKGEPLFLISGLALHTQNLARDPRACLLVSDPDPKPGLARGRVSLIGHITPITGADEIEAARARFLARHPGAGGYAGFKDFSFQRLHVESLHLVEGFGRIVEISREAFLAR